LVDLYPVGILAKSKCFYIAGPIINAPWPPDNDVKYVINDITDSMKEWNPSNYNLDIIKKVIWYSTVYGGLILMYSCEPLIPMSRVIINIGLDIEKYDKKEIKEFDDNIVLKAWALILNGNEKEGLELISGKMFFPNDFVWKPGNNYSIAVRGIKYL
jgi:hypothetical protein